MRLFFYPLPWKVYVHIETDYKSRNLTLHEYQFFNPIQNHFEQYSHLSEYKEAIAHLFKSNIYPYLLKKTGLKITVFSSLPPVMGLNLNGAFALCFAQGLVDKYLDLEKYKQGFGWENADKQKVLLELALEIESCFYDYTRNYSL